MANGNDLAQAYSILGQGMTSEYRRRRKEEEDREKRMMRNQLLGYFVSPLLKSAGEAVGKGVSGFTSDLILGDNARNYFDREEGIITARKAQTAAKMEKDISEQLGQLSTGGQSSQDGAFDLFNSGLRENMIAKYGDDDKTKQVIDSLLLANQEQIRTASSEWHDGLEALGIYAGKAPTPTELLTRAKNEDFVFGQTKGSRAVAKLASAFTSGSYEDKERESIRYLVTGRSDSANIPSWYLDFQNAGFEEELRKKFTNLQNMRPEALDNMMTEFISSTPEMQAYFNSLDEDNQREIAAAPGRRIRESELTALREKRDNNPLLRDYLNSTEGKRHTTTEDALRGFVSSIGAVSDLNTFATRYQLDAGAEQTATLADAVAVSTFGKDLDNLSDSEKSTVRTQTKEAVKVFGLNFNKDFAYALSQLNDEQLGKLSRSLTPGARRVLANDYVSFQINSNLRNEVEEIEPWFGAPYLEETDRLTATMKDPEAGLNFILSRISDDQYVDSASTQAVRSGISAQVKKENRQMVDPYFAALNMRELNNQFAFVDDPLLSKEEREQGIRDGLMQLEQAIGERALSEGYRMSDNTPNISPVLLDQLEEFRSSLLSRLYPSSPTGATTPVGLGI